jgi:hypothetical protein
MRPAATIPFICLFILTSGCTSSTPNQPTPQPSTETAASPASNAPNQNATPSPSTAAVAKVKFDACSVLTSAEIQAVQGEAVKETKPSDRMNGDFVVTLCYYELPTLSNSISLSLTERNPEKSGGQSVKDFWENTFGKDERKTETERKKDRDKEKEKARAKPEPRSEGEEEESAPMEPVRGVGDEAFWSVSRIGGALYVLKGDRYLRISVGGKGDAETKLKKSKTLAQKALRRW